MEIIELANIITVEKETVFNLWNYKYPAILVYQKMEDCDGYLENLTNLNHFLVLNIKVL